MNSLKNPPRLSLLTLFPAACAVGAGVVLWIAAGYAGSNGLAFAVTLLIAAFFAVGCVELWRFRQATAGLQAALQAVPDTAEGLVGWLQALPAALRNAVRQRVDGERAGLPGPALTPYITGLLVLLGMLGTFLGMVVTLNGTVIALESTTDLQSIRASLAAPVRGLGVAFGTSVAGVAASAMLGLMAALARRESLQTGQLLDSRIAGPLRVFSQAFRREQQRLAVEQERAALAQQRQQERLLLAQQRQQERLLLAQQREEERARQSEQHHAATLHVLQTLQSQVQQLPALVTQVQALMAQMDSHSRQLGRQLLDGQGEFHRQAEAAYAGLARSTQASVQGLAASLDRSLQTSLASSAQASGEAVRQVVAGAMSGLASDAAGLHARIADTAQQQFAGLAADFDATLRGAAQQWAGALHSSTTAFERGAASLVDRVATGFEQHAAGLLLTVDAQRLDAQAAAAAGDEQRLAAWTRSLQDMAGALQQTWQLAGEQAQAQTTHTLAEIRRLLQAAAEAPRAAADVIAQLRQQLSASIAHDNSLLQERERMLATLATLLDAVNHASTEQRAAIDALVAGSAAMLDRVGGHFSERLQTESGRLGEAAAQMTGSAVDMASLGEAFGHAVQLFSASNDQLSRQLQRIEGTLSQSIARSDEQLAYYVAQAREIIDLSLLSQKQIVEDLQRFSKRQAVLAGADA